MHKIAHLVIKTIKKIYFCLKLKLIKALNLEDIKYFTLLSSIYVPLLLAIILLFFKLNNNASNKYLVLLFINISFVYFMTYNRYYENFNIYAPLFPLQAFAVLNSFPLFYLYFLSLTKTEELSYKQVFLHFTLSLFFGLLLLVFMYYFMNSHERYLYISEQVYSNSINTIKFKFGYTLYRGGKIIYIIQSVIYLVLIIKQYKIHAKNTSERFSNNEGIDLSWLKYIGIAFGVVFIFNLIMHGLKLNYISTHHLIVIISYIIFSSFFLMLGILALNQKQVYSLSAIKYEKEDNEFTSSNISKKNIEKYLIIEKPYLNPEFNIYDLCAKFNTNRTYVSNIINKSFESNFRSLINSYRINDAKNIIKNTVNNNSKISLEEVSLSVGFSSYATFLRVFKYFENISPTKYREQL